MKNLVVLWQCIALTFFAGIATVVVAGVSCSESLDDESWASCRAAQLLDARQRSVPWNRGDASDVDSDDTEDSTELNFRPWF